LTVERIEIMTQIVKAIYEDGKLLLKKPLKGVKEHAEVTVSVSDEIKTEDSAEKRGWPKSFLETYGAIKDDTFERPPQGEFEKREPLD
jgi:predicted DNA-binding antitoxin AbrB/MazE fold protein